MKQKHNNKESTETEAQNGWLEFIKQFERADDVGTNVKLIGYHETIDLIRNKLDTLVKNKNKVQFNCLITGPAGTGKTIVVESLAKSCPKLNYLYLKSSLTLDKRFGNPGQRLEQLFDAAIKKAPSLIFIDDLELICGQKRSDPEKHVFNALVNELKRLKSLTRPRVLVFAATDEPESLDSKIKKASCFGDEIKFTLPSRNDRIEALTKIANNFNLKLSSKEIEGLSEATHCYLYSDLEKLCSRALDVIETSGDVPHIKIFNTIKSQFKPALIKSVTTPCQPLRWEDIGGVEEVKGELQRSVIWPIEHRSKFSELGIKSTKGALLYGPPGCSKTMLAQALATESGYNFIAVKGPELVSKWVGDSEKALRKLYRDAREVAPCIVFFDEIDGLAPERSANQNSAVSDKIVTTLLSELNSVEPLENVFTIAATNRPQKIDAALIRPGRLYPAIYIPLPTENDRREIFKVHMRPLKLKLDKPSDQIAADLAKRTKGYSGAEIAAVCQNAGVIALQESLDNRMIELRHFEESLKRVQPITRVEQLKDYDKFRKAMHQFGQRGGGGHDSKRVEDNDNQSTSSSTNHERRLSMIKRIFTRKR